MPRVFINYRREDSIAYAGRVYDRLASQFGAANIFMDIDTLEPGVDFVDALQKTVASCDVFLAVIGRQWLAVKDEEGQLRLWNPEDFVSIEISVALERQSIRVVPILVNGARMPRSTDLPERLVSLSRRNALELPDIGFHQALGRLIESIERAEREKQRTETVAEQRNAEAAARAEQERLEKQNAEAAAKAEHERLEKQDAPALRPMIDPAVRSTKADGGRSASRRRAVYLLVIVTLLCAGMTLLLLKDRVFGTPTPLVHRIVEFERNPPSDKVPAGCKQAPNVCVVADWLRRVNTLPCVASAALAAGQHGDSVSKPGGWVFDTQQLVTGTDNTVESELAIVTPEYLRVLELPLLTGRTFVDGDRNVAIVSSSAAKRVLPNGNIGGILGRQIWLGHLVDPEEARVNALVIVGVAGDSPESSSPRVYIPLYPRMSDNAQLLVRLASSGSAQKKSCLDAIGNQGLSVKPW